MSEERLNIIKENVYARCSIANITGIGMTAPDKEEVELIEEIERLNNIINEFESWLISWIENEQYCFMSDNPKDRCRREVYEEVLHHFKELKGSDK